MTEIPAGVQLPRLGPARDDGTSRTWNGLRYYFTQRTPFYDRHVVDAVRSGIRQVAVLGAGLDTRAFRLDLPADVVLFEGLQMYLARTEADQLLEAITGLSAAGQPARPAGRLGRAARLASDRGDQCDRGRRTVGTTGPAVARRPQGSRGDLAVRRGAGQLSRSTRIFSAVTRSSSVGVA